ncbi:MMPL family transporter [Salinisphaera sp. T31B1]|uniref:MMPL family transporter n=1 Tax=Salinisphaera sp. T31B1 TaxID=727963 RepID=UPI003340FE31
MSQRVARWIAVWVAFMMRHATTVVIAGVLLTAACGWYAATHLSMNTDNADLISPTVDWRQTYIAYQKAFPVYTDNLVVVVDGATPELAAAGTRRLAKAMRADRDHFESVYVPGGGDFFARNGLLYLDTPALERLSDRLVRIQPFLGRLSADPTLVTFFDLLDRAMAPDTAVDFDLAPIWRELDAAFAASQAEQFHRLSWQRLMGGTQTPGVSSQRFIIAAPVMNYEQLLPAAGAMARVRALVAQLDLDAEHGMQVRQTGEVALSDEELASVSRGAAWGAGLALAAVGLILYLGLRSWRLMAAALASLIAGLVGTAAFAALAVGTLNLISIAFAVLYIGLGIDYAIHLCLRYREALAEDGHPLVALPRAASDVGLSLLLCAITTAAGFFAFIPTPYSGVAELGLISGTGMFISLVISLTLLPALVAIMGGHRGVRPLAGAAMARRVPVIGPRGARVIWVAAGLTALACATALPFLRFDSNTLNLKDPSSESVTTYRELLADSDQSPLTLVTTAATPSAADDTAHRLDALPEVARALTVNDFVPDDQKAKLAIIGDLALTLALGPPDMGQPAEPVAQQRAIADFAIALDQWLDRAPDDEARVAGRHLADTLADWQVWLGQRPADQRARVLAELRASLLSGLGPQIETLTASLDATGFDRAGLPAAIRSRWIGQDGAYRVEAFASGDLNQPAVLRQFVASAQAVVPSITGAPVLEVAAGRTVADAFAAAFVYAAVFITVLLVVLLRSLADTLRVLAPLALTGLILCAVSVWADIPLNFANVIALPLLLGVGVDSGIHVVHRLRSHRPADGAFLASSTARAVVLSSLTTLAGFGSLAFSHHAGTASMGQLLGVGMVAILVTTLIVVPSLVGNANGSSIDRRDR